MEEELKLSVFQETKNSFDFNWVNKFIDKLNVMDSKNQLHDNIYLREYKVIPQ